MRKLNIAWLVLWCWLGQSFSFAMDQAAIVRRTHFSPLQTAPLRAWVGEHLSYPYAKPKTVTELATASGLTEDQVYSWLNNWRKRHWVEKRKASRINKIAIKRERPRKSGAIRTRNNFDDWQIVILKNWAQDHWDWPYPQPEQKRYLARVTRLGFQQISNWFTNWRLRHWRSAQNEEPPVRRRFEPRIKTEPVVKVEPEIVKAEPPDEKFVAPMMPMLESCEYNFVGSHSAKMTGWEFMSASEAEQLVELEPRDDGGRSGGKCY